MATGPRWVDALGAIPLPRVGEGLPELPVSKVAIERERNRLIVLSQRSQPWESMDVGLTLPQETTTWESRRVKAGYSVPIHRGMDPVDLTAMLSHGYDSMHMAILRHLTREGFVADPEDATPRISVWMEAYVKAWPAIEGVTT